MGFLGFIGGAMRSGAEGIKKKSEEIFVEKAREFSKKNPYELEELIKNVDNPTIKKAIVVAIALQGDPYRAVDLAKDNMIPKSFFEGLLTNSIVGSEVSRMISMWKNEL